MSTDISVALDPDRLVDSQELTEYLSCTRGHIYSLMERGMPSLKLGRARRFRISEVNSWLDSTRGGSTA